MTLARVRSLPGLLSLTVLAGSLTGVGLAAPAYADGTAPSASYSLDFTSLWIGQSVELTESDLKDDDTPPGELKREVNWGDGTQAQEFPADGSSLTHTFEETGDFKVTVKITDKSGLTADGTFPTANTVKVTTIPGTFSIQKKSLWIGDFAQPATVSVAKLTKAVKSGEISWGDGETSPISAKSKKASHKYAEPGKYRVSVVLSNDAGNSSPRNIGTITVKKDSWAPKSSVKTPANRNRVSSWKTLRGTFTDKGVGTGSVALMLGLRRGTTDYVYNYNKTTKKWRWVKESPGNEMTRASLLVVKPSKGKWKAKISGLKKGHLVVAYYAVDAVGNVGEPKFKDQKLTK